MRELVREGATSPPIDVTGRSPSGTHKIRDPVRDIPDDTFFKAGIEDDSDFVWPQSGSPPLDPTRTCLGPRYERGRGVFRNVMVADNFVPIACALGPSLPARCIS